MLSWSLYPVLLVSVYGILAGKLLISRLARRYPMFTTFVVFELGRSLAWALVPSHTNTYAHLYFFTQPVAWTLHALVVLELFKTVLESHKGIATLGRRVVSIAVGAAAILSMATLLIRLDTPESPYVTLEKYLLFERIINASLLGFLFVLLAFLAYFPVPLNRNALLHATIFGCYFLARTTLWLIRNIAGPEFTPVMNNWMNAFVVICLLAWLFFLNRRGEKAPVRTGLHFNKDQQERLVAHLDQINETLLGSARK